MAIAKMVVTFDCDIKEVWKVVTDNTNYSWRSDIKKIEIIDDTTFVEYDKKSNIKTTFKITDFAPYNTYKFDMENENMKGHWSGIFSEDNEKTIVEFTEDVVAKKTIMKPFVKGYLKKQQARYVDDLKKVLGSK